MHDEKDRIRKEAKRHRDALVINPDWASDVAAHFYEAVPVGDRECVSLYYPIGKEIDPLYIAEGLWSRNKAVCLPVVVGDAQPLIFKLWAPQASLVKGAMGILEPETGDYTQPDIVVIPLLAFDQRGGRIGYGKGHYDATLRHLRGEKPILAVGLAYAEQAVLLPLPLEPHDEKLDMVITPQRVFDFRR